MVTRQPLEPGLHRTDEAWPRSWNDLCGEQAAAFPRPGRRHPDRLHPRAQRRAPAAGLRALQVDAPAPPAPAADPPAAGDHRDHGAAARARARRSGRRRPDAPARGRADRRAHHRRRPGAGHRGQAAAQHPGGDLAGQRGRPLPTPSRPLAGAAGSELLRRRALRDRRRRALPLRHDQARALPVGQPRQRLATGAHPLLAAGPGLRAASRHADVLPRRPAVRVRPDLQQRARPGGPRPARRALLAAGTEPDFAPAYSFDIYLRGPGATPFEAGP